jgi:hypothetical protein
MRHVVTVGEIIRPIPSEGVSGKNFGVNAGVAGFNASVFQA